MSLRVRKKRLASFMALTDSTDDIPTGKDVTIVLDKSKTGLGLGIVGGSDTYLSGIVISEIDPDGVAARDGRLRVGDQILAVNGVELRRVPHADAVSILRVTSSPVSLQVVREDPEEIFTSDQEPTVFFTVCVKKSIREPFGISILERRNGEGIFVTKVEKESLLDDEGTIQQGDRLMQINGEDLTSFTQERAKQFLKRLYGEVVIVVGRIPSLAESLIKETEKRRELTTLDVNKLQDETNRILSVEVLQNGGQLNQQSPPRERSVSDGSAKRPSVVNQYDDGTVTYLKHVISDEPISSQERGKENDQMNARLLLSGKCGKEDYV